MHCFVFHPHRRVKIYSGAFSPFRAYTLCSMHSISSYPVGISSLTKCNPLILMSLADPGEVLQVGLFGHMEAQRCLISPLSVWTPFMASKCIQSTMRPEIDGPAFLIQQSVTGAGFAIIVPTRILSLLFFLLRKRCEITTVKSKGCFIRTLVLLRGRLARQGCASTKFVGLYSNSVGFCEGVHLC
jgi:hypothetical protein